MLNFKPVEFGNLKITDKFFKTKKMSLDFKMKNEIKAKVFLLSIADKEKKKNLNWSSQNFF